MLRWVAAYRLFFVLGLAVGLVVALALYLWHQYRPLKEEDVDNKKPLGLK